jgi:hypothetical protein
MYVVREITTKSATNIRVTMDNDARKTPFLMRLVETMSAAADGAAFRNIYTGCFKLRTPFGCG